MKVTKVLLCLLTAVALAAAVFGCGRTGPKEAQAAAEVKAAPESTAVSGDDAAKAAAAADSKLQESEASADLKKQDIITITIMIDGSDGGDKAIECSGKEELPAGSTAYDALKAICDCNEYAITGDSSYVKTIGGLGEGSFGAKPCGWMFMVDNEYPVVPADECELKDGSTVTWVFMK